MIDNGVCGAERVGPRARFDSTRSCEHSKHIDASIDHPVLDTRDREVLFLICDADPWVDVILLSRVYREVNPETSELRDLLCSRLLDLVFGDRG